MDILKNTDNFRNIRDFAYYNLKQNILNLNFKPGQRITENELVDMMKVSKTPIREALIFLVKEGLVETLPQSGTFISKIDLNAINEGREVRNILERYVHSLVIKYINDDNLRELSSILQSHRNIPQENYQQHFSYDELFHCKIYQICQKEKTFEMIRFMNYDYHRIRVLSLIEFIKFDQVIQEHQQIIDAIASKNEELLLRLTDTHLQNLQMESNSILNMYSSYFVKNT